MPHELRIVYLAHSLRSDWNNGNAHFLRGLMRELVKLNHHVTILEPETSWSIENLRTEPEGERSLAQFARVYSDLAIQLYSHLDDEEVWVKRLSGAQIVILHEWNPPALAQQILSLRDQLHFRLLFHDTHHRASSSPQQIKLLGLERFDGALVFGESLARIYRDRLHIENVHTLHEAADTSVFCPQPGSDKELDAVWIGNWGDGERSDEIRSFLLKPAAQLPDRRITVYGVRYPQDGLEALHQAGVSYGGYLPNLDAPGVYATAHLTVHIPRQQYSLQMSGIPTIRVFEALACGIPLLSAPWQDNEGLFRTHDFCFVSSPTEMLASMQYLLRNRAAAADQAARGLETLLARHTCAHRAQQLIAICQELLA
jgi:spore maturation protein CgeB